jgi:hypothetical protein
MAESDTTSNNSTTEESVDETLPSPVAFDMQYLIDGLKNYVNKHSGTVSENDIQAVLEKILSIKDI